MAWVVLAGAGVLTQALARGGSLGPFDLLAAHGLSAQPHGSLQNLQSIDQIAQMIPWTDLSWTQVHAGHLPLWNPYSALGMPLAFNWQSASFSLPALIGYLFPLSLAYTAQVFTTLVIAGSGTYVLARLLRCGVVAAVFAATVFELSGAFMTYLGWPIASVLSWTGWLLVAALLIIRGVRRTRAIALFAVALALAIYSGQPDVLTILGLGLAIFVAVVLVARRFVSGTRPPTLRPLLDLLVAAMAGAALAAPLLLPGLQVLGRSIRNLGGGALGGRTAIPILDFGRFLVLAQGGRSLSGDTFLAMLLVTLAIVAIGLKWKLPEVLGLAALALTMGALACSQPLISMLASTPGVEAVRWPRALALASFSIAILAGMGLDLLVRFAANLRLSRLVSGALFLVAAVLLGLWLTGGRHSQPVRAPTWAHGAAWVATAVALALTAIAAVRATETRRAHLQSCESRGISKWATWSALTLLLCSTTYLVVAGSPVMSSSPSYLPVTRAEVALQRAIGSAVVGFGTGTCVTSSGLGIEQNVNLMLRVQELAAYDPMLPVSYFRSWAAVTGRPPATAGYPAVSTYCPPITSAALARVYGVSYVLEPHGSAGPSGASFDGSVGDEDLYRIRNSGAATLVPATATSSASDTGHTLPVLHPNSATWELTTRAEDVELLRLRLTDTPGWHATIDGKPLRLTSYKQIMLQARIPVGTHRVIVNYWPQSFTVGIALALCSTASLIAASILATRRRRRIVPPSPS